MFYYVLKISLSFASVLLLSKLLPKECNESECHTSSKHQISRLHGGGPFCILEMLIDILVLMFYKVGEFCSVLRIVAASKVAAKRLQRV
jgi:hypothetical protein